MGNLTVVIGSAPGTYSAHLACANLDGSAATGVAVVYSSDNTAVATVDPSSGALTLVAAGTVNLTGTGTRGAFAHSDSSALTVTQDANTGDFTVALALGPT